MKRNIRKYLQVLEYFIKRTKWKKEQKKNKKNSVEKKCIQYDWWNIFQIAHRCPPCFCKKLYRNKLNLSI